MAHSSRATRRLVAKSSISPVTICRSCFDQLFPSSSRRYASASAAVAAEPRSSLESPQNTPSASRNPRKAFKISCSPVVSRPPLLTRESTSFEKAYYLYQKRLNERLSLPFTRYFYFKKGTPADLEWKRKAKVRLTAARDVGVYHAFGKEGWNDEVLVGSKLSEPSDIVDKLILDAQGKDILDGDTQGNTEAGAVAVSGNEKAGEGARKPLGDVEVERPSTRITEADQKNDQQSLNRKLDRALYLLVQRSNGEWRFPEDRVYGKESLHSAAERVLLQAGGINMNTWVVGNHPVGHYQSNYQNTTVSKIPPNALVRSANKEFEQEEFGEKVFFMRTRIMAGQADLSKNTLGDKDFLWLAKEEIREKVTEQYWLQIRHMLTER